MGYRNSNSEQSYRETLPERSQKLEMEATPEILEENLGQLNLRLVLSHFQQVNLDELIQFILN